MRFNVRVKLFIKNHLNLYKINKKIRETFTLQLLEATLLIFKQPLISITIIYLYGRMNNLCRVRIFNFFFIFNCHLFFKSKNVLLNTNKINNTPG